MRLHGNARLTPRGRTLMCRRVRHEGWTVAKAAAAAGCSERTCYRWLARYDAGEAMTDRSSAPRSVPGRTAPEIESLIEQLRRLRWTSTRIAAELSMATSTVGAVLRRQGLLLGTWCLDPEEALSPGQAAAIDRVYRAYPHLNDDSFVAAYLDEWLKP